MSDHPTPRRRVQFKVFRAIWSVRQALSYDIASGLKRAPFQFSLRTLFVVVTVVALLCPLGVWLLHKWQARTPWLLALVSIGLPIAVFGGLALFISKMTASIIRDRERTAKIERDVDCGTGRDDPPTPPAPQS